MRFVVPDAPSAWLARGIGSSRSCSLHCRCRDCAQDDDLPGRVGRVAEFAGQILLSPQDRPDEWEPIGINYPITSGVNLWVSGDGRAEVDYGGGQFRLAGDTNVHVARLDDRELALFIAQGRVIVRVRVQDPGEATRIDTPNTQVTLTRPGLYRIDVAPDRQTTTLVVREGEAQVALAERVQQVLPGQAVSGDRRRPRSSPTSAMRRAWTGSIPGARIATAATNARARRHTCRAQMVGVRGSRRIRIVAEHAGLRRRLVSDGRGAGLGAVPRRLLDRGRRMGPDVGRQRAVGLCAVPLRPLGVHRRPLGLVPGRVYVARPVWAPALVAWYGGPGWGARVGHGAPVYGWVPLGWREPYHPAGADARSTAGPATTGLCRERASQRPSAPPTRHANLAVPGRAVGRSRDSLGEAHAGEVEPRERSRAARIVGAAHAGRFRRWVTSQRQVPRSDAGDGHASACGVDLCDGAEAGRHITARTLAPGKSFPRERAHPARAASSAVPAATTVQREPVSGSLAALRNGRPMSRRRHTHRAGLRRRRSRRSSGNRRA